ISAHTNAFKINEDVVIPLPRLGDYSRGIERINIEYSIRNKLAIAEAMIEYLKTRPAAREGDDGDNLESRRLLTNKCHQARDRVTAVRDRWAAMLVGLDSPAGQATPLLGPEEQARRRPGDHLIDLLLRRDVRVSYRREVGQVLEEILSGQALAPVREGLQAIHAGLRDERLFVALHMHAGDGNVHTNIPVHSAHYAMLQESDRIVDRIMILAQSLGGVISGEHGIGMTKLRYLEAGRLEAFGRYKAEVDPEGHFNRGKLLAGSGLERAYTPSLRLLELEALILEESQLGAINDAIKHCLRCGKCQAVCSTHVPEANLLYSPRNKILATGLLLEAFLYEEQTRRGLSRRHFSEFNELADHCTVCHRCQKPCPVGIDFGAVTIQLREVLEERGQKRLNLGSRAALAFLNVTDPRLVRGLRQGMGVWGFTTLRWIHDMTRPLWRWTLPERPTTTAQAPHTAGQIVELIRQPPVRVDLPRHSLRTLLDIEDRQRVPVLRDPDRAEDDLES
ncbi:MAG: FAD-linked oxidase C-terminal domain-containing protein, partial [Pseudomonadota bacterium]